MLSFELRNIDVDQNFTLFQKHIANEKITIFFVFTINRFSKFSIIFSKIKIDYRLLAFIKSREQPVQLTFEKSKTKKNKKLNSPHKN